MIYLQTYKFGDLCIRLQPVQDRWMLLGHTFHIKKRSLNAIERKYSNVEERLIKVLEEWHAKTTNPTYHEVIKVLTSMEENTLVAELGRVKDYRIEKGEDGMHSFSYLCMFFGR